MQIFGHTNALLFIANSIHFVAILVPIVSMLKNKSCEGLSGKTQILYAIVFTARYTDLFLYSISWYNTVLKVLYIGLTYLTLLLIYWKYRSKENSKEDSFRAEVLVIFTFGLAFFVNYNFDRFEIAWSFSEYLEVLVIIPQLYMCWKSKRYASCVVLYVRLLALYRLFYIFNWMYRYCSEYYFDQISVVSGCCQTLILFIGVLMLRPKKEKLIVNVKAGKGPQLKMNAPGGCQPVIQIDPEDVSVDHPEEKIVPTYAVSAVPETDQMLDSTDQTPLFSPD